MDIVLLLLRIFPGKVADLCSRTIKMKHLAAYLLLGLGGNTEPSAEDIKGVLESVGIDADEDRLEKLIAELKGKDLQEVRRHRQPGNTTIYTADNR